VRTHQLYIKNNKGFSWTSYKNIHIKGFCFLENSEYLSEIPLAKYFENTDTINELHAKIAALNGMFTVIIETATSILLGMDTTRTFPLFYTNTFGQWLISDDANLIKEKYPHLQLNTDSISEFLCTGYVIGNKTLLNEVYQMEAAEIIELSNKKTKKTEYFQYGTEVVSTESFQSLQIKLKRILSQVTDRLIQSTQNRTIVVPLSGGYDSRIIATMLKEKGYKNVICFTYGKKNSPEVAISKKVARRLGYPWYFVEYTDNLIQEYFQKNKHIAYMLFSSNYVSLPHIQDYLAFEELKNSFPENSILVPGHSGDFFAGTHIAPQIEKLTTPEKIREAILSRHYTLAKYAMDQKGIYINEKYFPYSNMEAWSWKERQCKFIVNANRVYEFFNFEHRIPLWDQELLNFFKKVPVLYKNRKKTSYSIKTNLYDSVVFYYFQKYNIPFKARTRSLFSRILTRLFPADDFNNFSTIMKCFDPKSTISFHQVNTVISQYWIKYIKSINE